jgi:hypothetical protein
MTKWRFFAGATVLLAIAVVWVSQRADAIVIINSKGVDTGMLGVAAGQTARVHVLNASGFTADGPPCVVEVRFFDSAGVLLTREQKKIVPGHADFVDYSDLNLRTGDRRHVRAIVLQMLTGDFDQPTPSCIVTAEVLDNRTAQAGIVIINSHPLR